MNTPNIIATSSIHTTETNPRLQLRGLVLLVEDDASIRRYLEVIVRRAGYEVIVASDGLEAMKIALVSPVDVVVTDEVMPHLSGHELCRFLRHHPKLNSLPIILLSGLTDSPREEKDRADIYLAKPVRPEELTDCLERLILKAA